MTELSRRVVVIGGGFAGLACLVELRRAKADLELHLIDGEKDHCRMTCLHKTFHTPLKEFLTSFENLSQKLFLSFHETRASFGLVDLDSWQKEKCLRLADGELGFDALVVATGSQPVSLSGGGGVFDLTHLRAGKGMAVIEDFCAGTGETDPAVTFVGGGATGIQALFEVCSTLRDKGSKGTIRLLSRSERLVSELPEKFHDYIVKQMFRAGIEFFPRTAYLRQAGEKVLTKDLRTGRQGSFRSQLTFLFPGVRPSPLRFETNSCGQVLHGDKTLQNIFAAGDCSFFVSSGLNSMTAQAAIHKGRLVARNVLALLEGDALRHYGYREKGYFISLGRADAVGWLGTKSVPIKGFPALVLKEAAETQFALFLGGINTYRLLD